MSGKLIAVDFTPKTKAKTLKSPGTVHTLLVRDTHAARDAAYRLYCQASTLDENSHTWGQAEALYRRALTLDSTLAIAITNLGNIACKRGNDTRAEALYREAIAIDPRQPEAHYNLGFVLFERSVSTTSFPSADHDAAIACFERALLYDPKFNDALYNLASALYESGRLERAREHFQTYVEREPTGEWADMAREHLKNLPEPKTPKKTRKKRTP
jgi:tetratricopeptide (TPR) repeat protein